MTYAQPPLTLPASVELIKAHPNYITEYIF